MTMDKKEDVVLEESLRDDFRALRSDVEASGAVPDFETMMVAARADARNGSSRGVWTHPGTWMSVAMAAAVAGLLLVGPGQDTADADFERLVAAYSADATLGAWRSPTEGLMQTPGVDLGAVPSITPTVPSERPRPEGGRDL